MENRDKIHWYYLCQNPNAISLLEENQDKLYWFILSTNPSIFTYDYHLMKKVNIHLKEDIIAAALHPKRIFKTVKTDADMEEIYECYFE